MDVFHSLPEMVKKNMAKDSPAHLVLLYISFWSIAMKP